MPRFFRSILRSFYDADFYRYQLKQADGLGLSHLLWLNLLIITPSIVGLIFALDNQVFADNGQLTPSLQQDVAEITAQIPPLSFDKGQLHSNVEQPYTIYLTRQDKKIPLAVIDINAPPEAVLKRYDAFMLLTREGITVRQSAEDYEFEAWGEHVPDGFRLNSDIAQTLAEERAIWAYENRGWLWLTIGLTMWVFTLMAYFLYRTLQAVFFAGVTMLVMHLNKGQLAFPDAMRLAVFAITPPIVIDALAALLFGEKMSLWLFIALSIGYVMFAVLSNKDQTEDENHSL